MREALYPLPSSNPLLVICIVLQSARKIGLGTRKVYRKITEHGKRIKMRPIRVRVKGNALELYASEGFWGLKPPPGG